ncbi:MAG: hypothetical protein AABX47_02225 [Nanoarchaeota archaeon]
MDDRKRSLLSTKLIPPLCGSGGLMDKKQKPQTVIINGFEVEAFLPASLRKQLKIRI